MFDDIAILALVAAAVAATFVLTDFLDRLRRG